MPLLFVATTNRDKLREIKTIMADRPVSLRSLADFPAVPEPDEPGATFEENARIKALYYDARLGPAVRVLDAGALTVAEDSGLVVDALGGEPGVRSARFVSPDASYEERFAEIYRRLAVEPDAPRDARFVCALAVVHQGQVVFETTRTVEGTIAEAPSGTAGFGYDPILFYPPYNATLADVSQEEKLRVAHRGAALRALATWLERSSRPS
ncbi:MAG: non-canonical purine NTP pyrophosphatase [Vicinamibacterales bacterium]